MYKMKFVLTLTVSLFLCGCASDEFYKDKAADSAREFLLNNLANISPENKAYIDYTYPEILAAPILQNYSQFCFAWDLPSPEVTLLVYGSSKNNLRAWFPLRVIIKEYTEEEKKARKEVVLEEAEILGTSSDEISGRSPEYSQ
jgi:hypothetical protein